MDSDLWSLHAVFVSLFVSLLICLFCFNYIEFIEALSDSNHGQEFYFLSEVSSGSIVLYFMFVGHIGNPLLPPATSRSISCWPDFILWVSSLFLMYPPYWIQLLPIATRIPFPVKLWASSVWSWYWPVFPLYLIYITVCCPWQQVIRCIHESKQILKP